MERASEPDSPAERRALIVRALERHLGKLARKLEGLRGDLAEAQRAPEYRKHGETLLSYLHQVPARAERVSLPDLEDPQRSVEIALDPKLKPQENAARFFKRAAKGERGIQEVPPRIAAVESELRALEHLLDRSRRAEEHAPQAEDISDVRHEHDPELERDLERALARLPLGARRGVGREPRGATAATARASAEGRAEPRAPLGRLEPRRLRTKEGWDVMIGRSNEGNDYLTHRLARPEDYWLHVHGAAGSHVVIRRGKGKNEPSKQTVHEVAAWAAFYSQARTAGKVPVIVTRKKYVRKPRKAPPGLVVCERESSVMVRPSEPPREALAREAPE